MRSKLMACQPIHWSFFISLFADLPNLATKNISVIYPLVLGSFVIARTPRRHFIGEVLNMYKKGSNSRHNSIVSTSSDSKLSYISLRVHLPLVDNVGVSLVITIQVTVTGLTKLLFAGNRFIRQRPHRVWTSHWSCALVFSLSAGHSVWIAYSLACWPGTIPPWTKTIPGQQCR